MRGVVPQSLILGEIAMKVKIDRGEYFKKKELRRFMEGLSQLDEGLQSLTEEEFSRLDQASRHLSEIPDSGRYFNELFEEGLAIVGQRGKKEKVLVFKAMPFLPVLLGYQATYMGSSGCGNKNVL